MKKCVENNYMNKKYISTGLEQWIEQWKYTQERKRKRAEKIFPQRSGGRRI
jgi:hypothetical protein